MACYSLRSVRGETFKYCSSKLLQCKWEIFSLLNNYCHIRGSNSAWCVASLKACTSKNYIKRFCFKCSLGRWCHYKCAEIGVYLRAGYCTEQKLGWTWITPSCPVRSALLILSLIFTPTSPGQPQWVFSTQLCTYLQQIWAVRLCSLLAECQDNCWINLVVWDSSMRNCCIAQSLSPLAHWRLCPLWRRDIQWQMEPVPEGPSGNT